MKIKINYLDHEIQLFKEYVSAVEIENKKYFYRIILDLYNIFQKNISDEIIFLDEQNHEVNYSNKLKIFIDYFDFQLGSKKVINEISKYVESELDEENKDQLMKQYTKIANTYKKILNEIDLPLSINPDIDIENLTKLMKLNIVMKNDLLDNLLLLIDLEKVLKTNNLLVFVNLKQYLTKEELLEFYKYSIYNQVDVLLIDSQSYGIKLEFEKKLIIDSDLDEFMLE